MCAGGKGFVGASSQCVIGRRSNGKGAAWVMDAAVEIAAGAMKGRCDAHARQRKGRREMWSERASLCNAT